MILHRSNFSFFLGGCFAFVIVVQIERTCVKYLEFVNEIKRNLHNQAWDFCPITLFQSCNQDFIINGAISVAELS